jgi:hypothetical protein
MLAVNKTVLTGALISLATFSCPIAQLTEVRAVEFNRDVRPILTENCYACHGPDKNQRKAKLRLDVAEVALEKGAIVPGNPEQSKLIQHVFSTDPDELMPPPKSRKVLTPKQKEVLRDWIAGGGTYEQHWAYLPLRRPDVPQPVQKSWSRNTIDDFILQTLESKGIEPSKEANKATLLRRVSLDLIGLPPTPTELDAFLKDSSPNAYENQVDRLLRSPHFGERMAVPWLDVVRYADTVGYHGDQNQNIFPYRDYVIESFNRDKSFDQFTVEQIAGDLLPAPSFEQQVASGFNRLNMMTREGGAQDKEYLAKYAADRVRTISMAWLGSTMGCAECHDHKYDPFTSKDFYQMESFFTDIKQWGVYSDYDYTPNPDLKGVGNDHPFPPEIEVDVPYLKQRIVKLRELQASEYARAAAKLSVDQERQTAFKEWRGSTGSFLQHSPDGWISPLPTVALRLRDTNAVSATNYFVKADGLVRLSALPRENTQLTLSLSNTWVSAIRLQIIPQIETKDQAGGVTKFKAANIGLSAKLKPIDQTEDKKLSFYFADADYKTERYANGQRVLGVTDHWQTSPYQECQTGVWLLETPVQVSKGATLVLDLGSLAVQSVRVSVSPLGATSPLKAGANGALNKASQSEQELMQQTFLLSTQEDPQSLKAVRKLEDDIRECRSGRAFTMVTMAREPASTRVLRRGNWQDDGGEVVQPLAPHFLPQIANPEKRRLTRLDLARWLVCSENPLTARAVMNRLWKQFFGTGLSAVVDDLGAQGEWPVHPELLDWLACEFMRPGTSASVHAVHEAAFPWGVKHMVKLMVMSATYRQDSNQRPELKDLDPNNRLLACQSPRRLDAEFVRDNALSIAGMLNDDIGGPSVFPYQPAGYYSYLQWPDREYYPDSDTRQYRRGLYTHWQRAFLHPMLANFDAPSREECTANRIVSDTPQQALTLLNDPTFLEAARVFAASLLTFSESTDNQKLDKAFVRALARTPKDQECRSLLGFLEVQREHYEQAPDDAAKVIRAGNKPQAHNEGHVELAAWTQVCRVILNLHETITRY